MRGPDTDHRLSLLRSLRPDGTVRQEEPPNGHGIDMYAINRHAILGPNGHSGEALGSDGETPASGVDLHAIDMEAVTRAHYIPIRGKNGKTQARQDIQPIVVADLGVEEVASLLEPIPPEVAEKKRRLRSFLHGVIRSDRHDMAVQRQQDAEAASVAERMKTDVGLRQQVDGILSTMPAEEQAVARRILAEARESSVGRAIGDIEKLKRAHQEEEAIRSGGYPVVGSGWGDRAMVGEDGLRVFHGKAGPDEEADTTFAYADIVNQRLTFTVPPRPTDGLTRLVRRTGRKMDLMGSVVVRDSMTGREYTLMGVEHPDTFVDDLLARANVMSAGQAAKDDLARLMMANPELLDDA